MNEPIVVNGWRLFAHPLFMDQLEKLSVSVTESRLRNPDAWQHSANAKLLAALRQLIFHTIPEDPSRAEYRQGGTLGSDRKHWFRVKFGAGRFRLFFRYSSKANVIIYAWVNDETTLRTYGAKTDAYAVFRRMLDNGNPPDTWEILFAHVKQPGALDRLAASRNEPS